MFSILLESAPASWKGYSTYHFSRYDENRVWKKRYGAFLSVLFFLVCSTAFAKADSRELLVFAGAGMRVPLDEIGKRFEEAFGIRVIYDYQGSGRLGNKILVGQTPDVFIPGSDKWAKILKKKGYVNDYIPSAYHTPLSLPPKGTVK